MKRILLLISLLFLAEALASPTIENFSITPNNLWIGDAPAISLGCFDENHTINSVYSKIVGPYIIFPTLNFAPSGGIYILESSRIKPYLDRTGKFTVTVYCVNDANETSTNSGTFTISELTLDVSPLKSNSVYAGDNIEVNLQVKKDGSQINTYDVTFHSFFDNQVSEFTPTQPYYDERKGWVLKMNSPTSIGDHELKVLVNYNGREIFYITQITVKKPIQFEITLNNNTEISSSDNITLRIKAFEKDNKITLKKDYLILKMDSTEISSDKFSILNSGSIYDDITLIPPALSVGSHNFRVEFNYKGYSLKEERTIFYVSPFYGKILNYNDEPISTEFILSSNGIEKRVKTEKNGSYYGFIYPSTYKIQIKFPSSVVDLTGVNIQEGDFDKLILYNYFENFDVSGIRGASVYFYDIYPEFSNGSIKMYYDSRYLINEKDLGVYGCSNWDPEDNVCDGNLEDVDFELDDRNDYVKVEGIDYNTYVIGNEKSISLEFSLNKRQYYVSDFLTVDGIVKDDIHEPVGNATVNVLIKGTAISSLETSSGNGIFSMKMPVPENEGNYTILINVEKNSYGKFNTSSTIEILKKREVSLVFPQTIRVEQGENSSVELSIVNVGQADLSNVNLSINGIPSSYYTLAEELGELKVGEVKRAVVNFFIPTNATEGTFSGKFKASYMGRSKEEIFGFTVVPKSDDGNQTNQEFKPSPAIGKFILPQISLPDFKLLYIIPFALVSFVSAFIIKKSKKSMISEDGDIKKMFSEIKLEIRSKDKKEGNSQNP